MKPRLFSINRLQRKVLLLILAIVVLPMLIAAWLTSTWVSSGFEDRLEGWIEDSAHVGQTWLQAYQNDATILGRVLADDTDFLDSLDGKGGGRLQEPVHRIAKELGVSFIQVYTPEQKLIYSSAAFDLHATWERGQTEAVFRITQKPDKKNLLAAVGITPVPRQGPLRYYLVLGSLLDNNFMRELSQLTGLKTRLYYRDGNNYYDVFSKATRVSLRKHLTKQAINRLQVEKKPYYGVEAEGGRFRGQYTPIMDSTGRVEAIMFNGLERRGLDEFLSNQIVLFAAISMLGIIISGLTGLFLSRLVLKPIEQLRDGVMQVAGQNFNTSVPASSDDELGDLAKAFNAMTVRMREARDEQQQRFQQDKLSALGELSAALAHEIRNPIGVINTASALLEKSASESEKVAELVRMIREESVRISDLIQDFLQLSRYRQPQLSLVDPVLPLARALDTLLADKPNVRITRYLEHGATQVKTDIGLLQQAWGNILTNALQAMGIKPGELILRSWVRDAQVWVSLEDSGPGISPEVMPRIFEPFFTTKEQGTGLGLSIAYTLVEASAGRLEILPPEKSGARFAMHFSIHEQALV